jgi:hypothetical protein
MTPTLTGPTPLTYGRDPSIAKWTVRQYQRMIEEGIITEADRVELLEGWIVRKDVLYTEPTEAAPLTYGRDPSLYTFTLRQYQRMIETGILGPYDRVELLDNWVVLKMTQGPIHSSSLQGLARLLFNALPIGWDFRIQSAIELATAQPEPDGAVVRGGPANYRLNHPRPAEIGLLIEVADSSLLRDRRDKGQIYARADVVRYWIVNLVDDCIEVYEQPSGPTAVPSYATVTTYARGTTVPLILDGVTVATFAVDDVLP